MGASGLIANCLLKSMNELPLAPSLPRAVMFPYFSLLSLVKELVSLSDQPLSDLYLVAKSQ